MNNPKTFKNARLRLTAWYLTIIMTLSVLFSVVVYRAFAIEVGRFGHAQRTVIGGIINKGSPPPIGIGRGAPIIVDDPEILASTAKLFRETNRRILYLLIAANAGILAITGGIGYFLAGKTLQPIEEAMAEQNRFITDASHELKTPLTALRAEFEVAMTEGNKITREQSGKLIKSGFEEIVKLQRLAENLLELTQRQKLRKTLHMTEVSLLEVIEEAFKKVVPQAKKKHIVISNNTDDYILKGEYQSLAELFVILLDNAIKYSPEKSEIKLSTEKTDHQVIIKVVDQGIGIDKKDLKHIFDRFYRADKSRYKVQGYGLGLAIAKEIVDSLKGTITVESKVGKGTTFILKFPVKS